MAKKHTTIVDRMFKTIIEKNVKHQQQIIENMESKNYRQSSMLAHLNQECDQTAQVLKAKDQLIIQQGPAGPLDHLGEKQDC